MKSGKGTLFQGSVILISSFYAIIDILLLSNPDIDSTGYVELLGAPMLLWLIIFVLSLICYAYQQKGCGGKMLFMETMALLRYSFFAMFMIINTLLIALWLFILCLILTGQFDD